MSESVFVAMSGGVDSTAAAYLLKQAGYHVEGIHFSIESGGSPVARSSVGILEQTCEMLGIKLHHLEIQKEFSRDVIEYFCGEYESGLTPNPCVRCNKKIKFGLLLDKITEMGGDYLATGHYAVIDNTASSYRLLKGIDKRKDQSYFLYTLGQKELKRLLFPLGRMRKDEVKEVVAALKLPAAESKESQDICFIPDNDSRAFIAGHVKYFPGDIVDINNNVLGRHKGLPFYTVGQRQGLGISAKEPLYVLKLDSVSNSLIVGEEQSLYGDKLVACELHWISGESPAQVFKASAKIRYTIRECPVEVELIGGTAEVKFEEAQRAIAPGQSVVFYEGDVVLGGGIIG